jgi:hypothetical protein
LGSVLSWSILHIYKWRQHNETKQSFFFLKNRDIIEGEVNLFKVHGMYVWNYHLKTPLYY